MHRHSYNGRKLQRAAGPRKALIRGQITSLILHEAIVTTEAKAKEVAPYFERLVTKAKQANLAGERAVRRVTFTEGAAQKLINELAPSWSERHGGYTRVVKLPNRRGDNAPMASLSLVIDKIEETKPEATPVKKTATKKKSEVA
jgi:large subunit ribosomal protein L17